ncbi:hypothetical protein R5Q06_03235 [Oenococcus oeni]
MSDNGSIVYKLKDVPRISSRNNRLSVGTADDTEEFADDRWKVRISHYVAISTSVQVDGFPAHPINFFMQKFGFVPIKQHGLRNKQIYSEITFDVDTSSDLLDAQKIDWYWKVRNVGEEAIRRNDIRGEIFPEKPVHNKVTHIEPIVFKGPHFVEVYGIKNSVLVVFGKVDVILNDGSELSIM